MAILGNFAVICVGVLLAFTLLRLHPRRITIPAGCLMVAWAAIGTAFGFPGGHGPAPWAEAIAAGAGLAAVALSAGRGRARVAGLVLAGVVLLGSSIVPRAIGLREAAAARAARFSALGFPLVIPVVPGYHVAGADPAADGTLSFNMENDSGDPMTSTDQFAVIIAPAGNKTAADTLAICTPGPGAGAPPPSCQALGPGLWLNTATGSPEVVAGNSGMAAIAIAQGDPPASNQVLIRAVSALRPASAAEVAALPALLSDRVSGGCARPAGHPGRASGPRAC
jgi:hypothetical protein